MTKKLVKEKLELIDERDFLGTITNVIDVLKDKVLTYNNFVTLCIEKEYYPGSDNGYNFIIVGERYETDEEYQKRLVLEEKTKDRKKQLAKKFQTSKLEKEQRVYERLKKKFEKEGK